MRKSRLDTGKITNPKNTTSQSERKNTSTYPQKATTGNRKNPTRPAQRQHRQPCQPNKRHTKQTIRPSRTAKQQHKRTKQSYRRPQQCRTAPHTLFYRTRLDGKLESRPSPIHTTYRHLCPPLERKHPKTRATHTPKKQQSKQH